MDNYYDIEEPKNEKGITVKRVLKWICFAIMAFVIVTLVVRCSIYRDDGIVREILVDDVFMQAYEASPEDFSVRQYGMNSAWVPVRDGRLIEFNYLYHIEAAHELQFSVKYNKDISEWLNDDGIPFKFRLIDSSGNVYTDYYFKSKSKLQYNFLRICFHGIDLEADGVRTSYTLYIDALNEDGTYGELCSYKLYDGSTIYKEIKYNN